MRYLVMLVAALGMALCGGCASGYIPPSGRADFTSLSSSSMQQSFAAKPAAIFPAYIAAVRIQAPAYHNYYTEREGGVFGHGRYSVVTVKEVEEASDIERIGKLPQVGGLVAITPLLLPENLTSDQALREAAARLKADMVLLYTFDTSFYNQDASVALNVVTLGLTPTRRVNVRVTASALLMDTRTGFIYTALEATEKKALISNVWESSESADRARRNAEKAAFKALVDELEKSWPQVIERAKQGA